MISAKNHAGAGPVVDFISMLLDKEAGTKRQEPETSSIRQEDWFSVCQSSRWQDAVRRSVQFARATEPSVLSGEFGVGKLQVALHLHFHTEMPRLIYVPCGQLAVLLDHATPKLAHEWHAILRDHGLGDRANWLFQRVDKLSPTHQTWIVDLVSDIRRVHPASTVLSTSRNSLQQLFEAGQMREELMYLLGVLEVRVPALRERPKDVLSLIEHFGRHVGNYRGGLQFTHEALELLKAYPWPGNVIELRNLILRLQATSSDKLIGPTELDCLRNVATSENADLSTLSLEDAETQLILKALTRNAGNKTATAKQLGITTRTLHNKMRKYRSLGLVSTTPDE